ncbi:hypothetical protein B9Z65_1454 [Elsinoe australis]|uniref:Uncharacterized protein n=1 Tax=Elsinoe australis TaxID=40998 RepID=A0A2P7YFY9_9PEZI|nr:hypothetical protein B9Z65_1454 [Elsinoe australis]
MPSLHHTSRPAWKRPRFRQRISRNPSGIFRLNRVRLSKRFFAITENGEPSLLKFPPEVRLMIYNFIAAGTTRKLVYDDKHEKDFWEYKGDKDENDLPPLWALALTCFTVYQEAMPVIYRDILVSMTVDKDFFTSKSADRLSQTAILQLVRQVSLKISVSPDMPESLLLVYKMFNYCKGLEGFNDIMPISKRQWVPVSAGEDMGVAHLYEGPLDGDDLAAADSQPDVCADAEGRDRSACCGTDAETQRAKEQGLKAPVYDDHVIFQPFE